MQNEERRELRVLDDRGESEHRRLPKRECRPHMSVGIEFQSALTVMPRRDDENDLMLLPLSLVWNREL
jgi:hypothetical protein